MPSPKIQKAVLKIGLGLIGSAAIGYLIKAERRVEDRIDEHFAEPEVSN